MHVIRVRNVQQALPEGVYQLLSRGIPSPSRFGDVLMLPEPVTTVYDKPAERVLFWPQRDANPFFHFFEGLWMLAGRDDVEYVAQFVKNMLTFSDDGKTFHGAYGDRWRNHFFIFEADGVEAYSFDQIKWAIKTLKADPLTRRVVIQMWDAECDPQKADAGGKDVPCNTQLYVWNLSGCLNMTITCRSNDMVWGAYGANAVHFSMLLEYMAGMLNLEIGKMYQVSNNFHGYQNSLDPIRPLYDEANDGYGAVGRAKVCPYADGTVAPFRMINDNEAWDLDLALFMADPGSVGFRDPFFTHVAKPLWWAHKAYKQKDFKEAKKLIKLCRASDWRQSCLEWLQRRVDKAEAK